MGLLWEWEECLLLPPDEDDVGFVGQSSVFVLRIMCNRGKGAEEGRV